MRKLAEEASLSMNTLYSKFFLILLVGGVTLAVLIWLASKRANQDAYALIDLVETNTVDESYAFIKQATQIAEEVGGRSVVTNEVVMPMVIPDERAEQADHATRLLVITEYPTRQAGETALGKRQELLPEYSEGAIRTYAAAPARGIESLIVQILPATLALLGRESVPKSNNTEKLPSLIEAAHILDDEPSAAIFAGSWADLVERQGDQPVWMLNFLEYSEVAGYGEDPEGVAPATSISGASAYETYVRGMIGSLGAVGSTVGWSSNALPALANTEDGDWHQIVVPFYPSLTAMMTMLALPEYQAAHVHRVAGLKRTRLLATQPINNQEFQPGE